MFTRCLLHFNGIFMESLWNPRGLGGGLGVNFTVVCTLTPEFWDIPWVQSSVKYGSHTTVQVLPRSYTSSCFPVQWGLLGGT
jgi:hypothetical protein